MTQIGSQKLMISFINTCLKEWYQFLRFSSSFVPVYLTLHFTCVLSFHCLSLSGAFFLCFLFFSTDITRWYNVINEVVAKGSNYDTITLRSHTCYPFCSPCFASLLQIVNTQLRLWQMIGSVWVKFIRLSDRMYVEDINKLKYINHFPWKRELSNV